MKPSEILRMAARRVERGDDDLGCSAIERSARAFLGMDGPADSAFLFFKQIGYAKSAGDPWWGGWASYDRPENRNARIIGLCLAAAIAESEGQ